MILVVGGAGYIGSHCVLFLREAGYEVLVVDDLSEGHVGAMLDAPFVRGSLLERDFLAEVFATHSIDAVLHFAARCYVGESVREPARYYRNNVVGTLNLLETMVQADVHRLVFSSTCATYGEPSKLPITEDEPQAPVNPYGETKLVCERMLADFRRAHGLESVALRLFNAAGADPQGRLGEDHDPETHLIPLVIQTAQGLRDKLTVFGDDYETRDGTCVRDYVHVNDLAQAHMLALQAMEKGNNPASAYNLGNEQGSTVLEVIEAARLVTGREIPFEVGPRRPGDPPVLVGSTRKIRDELGWQPEHGDIEAIVGTAWRWHEAHPQGYGGEG